MLTTLAVCHYRSINKLIIPQGRLNLVTGPNGSGKSNLYKALRLLAETAQGGVDRSGAVARLIRRASEHSQVWAVSHADRLIEALEDQGECNAIRLEKELGQTQLLGQRMFDEPAWHWPS